MSKIEFRSTYNNILVLAPHTDDGELGCGGTIAKFIEEGAEVYYAAFSTAEESVPEGLPKDILKTEVRKATSVLGIPSNNLFVFDYEVRKLSYSRQSILDDLVHLDNPVDLDKDTDGPLVTRQQVGESGKGIV